MPRKLTTQEFIQRSNKIHKNKYNYSKTEYISSTEKVKIICPIHGEFLQTTRTHLAGHGCPKCSFGTLTISDFIKQSNRLHNNKYDYSKVSYNFLNDKTTIICPKHGEFIQSPNKHLQKRGCPECKLDKLSKIFRLSKNKFIKRSNRIHNNKYDYSKINYINAHKLIEIICPKHGNFWQEPNIHMRGSGCQKCSFNGSKAEKEWLDSLEQRNNTIIERNKQITIEDKNFVVDGFYKLTNTCYEYNGSFWHGNPNVYDQNDINPRTKTTFGHLYQKTLEKEKMIKSAGYNLITKWGN